MNFEKDPWFESEKGKVHQAVFEQVSILEREQGDAMERMAKLYWLYDPESEGASASEVARRQARVVQNFIATNVDTVAALVTANDLRPRILTDDADWSIQRKAEHLSWYGEALGKKLELHSKCAEGFRLGGAIRGVGLVKVDLDAHDQIVATMVLPDDIIVSKDEANYGPLLQMHQASVVHYRKLLADHPDAAEHVKNARGGGKLQRHWPDYRQVGKDHIAVLESWVLPVGVKGELGYKVGRHTKTMYGHDLIDEEWEWPWFPFAEFRWAARARQWHGISLAERIQGHQRMANKYNWQMDLLIDKWAIPTTYVTPADANVAIKTTLRTGTYIVTKSGQPPVTVIPPAVSADMYKRSETLEASASRETGVSTMAAHGAKPAGIEAGVAIREYRDATTEKFALQEKNFERMLLDAHWLGLWCAKRAAAKNKAPEVVRRSVHGPRKIKWADVDPGEVRVQMAAASTLSRSPAGRAQFVLEMAQGNVISQDVARKLLMPNSPLDIEREMSMYEAAMDSADAAIEHILDGGEEWPDGFQNARMNVWRGQAMLLRISREPGKAPEDVIESLRQWVVQSAWIVAQSEKTPPAPMLPGAGMEQALPGAGAVPPMLPPGAMPPGAMMPPGADPAMGMTGAGVQPANLLGV